MAMPTVVKQQFEQLSREQQKAFKRDLAKRSKGNGSAYLAWLLLGWHYLYLGKVGLQFAFWFTGGFFVIGWFIVFFRIPGMVTQHNDDLARALMVEYRQLTA